MIKDAFALKETPYPMILVCILPSFGESSRALSLALRRQSSPGGERRCFDKRFFTAVVKMTIHGEVGGKNLLLWKFHSLQPRIYDFQILPNILHEFSADTSGEDKSYQGTNFDQASRHVERLKRRRLRVEI